MRENIFPSFILLGLSHHCCVHRTNKQKKTVSRLVDTTQSASLRRVDNTALALRVLCTTDWLCRLSSLSPTWRTNSHGWTDFSFSLSPRALTSSFTGDTSKERQTVDRNRCHVINWSWSLPRRSHCWLLIALLTTADDDQTNTQQMPTLLWLMAREKKSTEIWGWPPPPRDFCFFGESLFLSHSQGSCCLSDFLTHTLVYVCVCLSRVVVVVSGVEFVWENGDALPCYSTYYSQCLSFSL